MVTSSVWFSIVLGVGLGAVSVVISYIFLRHSAEQDVKRFLTLVLGSMVLRLVVISAFAVLILLLVPVQKEVFIIAMLFSLLVGIAFDTRRLYVESKKRIE